MDFATLKSSAIAWLAANSVQLAITVSLAVVYLLLDRFSTPRLEESAEQGRFKTEAGTKAVRVARLITGLFGALILIFVWGIDLSALVFFTTTTVTLLGVALFANWSVLSNVTAYFVLMLQPSFRRGNFIRILDADNYIEGYIADLTLFHTRLISEGRETLVYPNNLLLGKACLINPRDRLNGVGKIAPPPPPAGG